MADKKYNDYDPGTYDPNKIFLQADPDTGALEKVNLPVIPSASDNILFKMFPSGFLNETFEGSEVCQWEILESDLGSYGALFEIDFNLTNFSGGYEPGIYLAIGNYEVYADDVSPDGSYAVHMRAFIKPDKTISSYSYLFSLNNTYQRIWNGISVIADAFPIPCKIVIGPAEIETIEITYLSIKRFISPIPST